MPAFCMPQSSDGGYFQLVLNAQFLLDFLALGEGEPVAVNVETGQLDYRVFYNVASVPPPAYSAFWERNTR